jgi:hypothetical protein
MKTLDWSIETLGRECDLFRDFIHLLKTRVAKHA